MQRVMKHLMLALSLIAMTHAHSMEISYSAPSTSSVGKFLLKGEIKKGDLSAIKALIKSEGYPEQFHITSQGGSVIEAMKIGRFFRQTFATVIAGKQCDSACFFVWSGAYLRIFISPIGLHRPYFDRVYFAGLSVDEAMKKYAVLMGASREYLLEMDIPNAVVDKMFATDSDKIWYMENGGHYGESISQYAPALREWMLSRCGHLKMTSDELIDHIMSHNSSGEVTEYGKDLSAGYVEYVDRKWEESQKCRKDVMTEVRKPDDIH